MVSDIAITRLIRDINAKIEGSTSINAAILSDLGILFSVLRPILTQKLDEAENFESAHSILKFHSYLGAEFEGILAFEKALGFAIENKNQVYLLACSYWILFSNSNRKNELRAHFETVVKRSFGEQYTKLLIEKLAERKMPFY